MSDGPTGFENQDINIGKASIGESSTSSKATRKSPFFNGLVNKLFPDRESKPALEFSYPVSLDLSKVDIVDNAKIKDSMEGIGKYYQVSPEKVRWASETTKMYILTNTDFEILQKSIIKALVSALKRDTQQKQEDKKIKIDAWKFDLKHVKEIGGLIIDGMERNKIVLVKEGFSLPNEHVKTHEFLHVLSAHQGDWGCGFSTKYKHGNLNEAATEILTLAYVHQELSENDLTAKILNGGIEVGHAEHVKKLLNIMAKTVDNGRPFSIKDLARHYFGDPSTNVSLLQEDLISRVDEKQGEEIRNIIANDLRKNYPKQAKPSLRSLLLRGSR